MSMSPDPDVPQEGDPQRGDGLVGVPECKAASRNLFATLTVDGRAYRLQYGDTMFGRLDEPVLRPLGHGGPCRVLSATSSESYFKAALDLGGVVATLERTRGGGTFVEDAHGRRRCRCRGDGSEPDGVVRLSP